MSLSGPARQQTFYNKTVT
uniref:Uncharacterized protein n=1 Tax=Anguilla anguilla TaxID=7936 RepID=A0A0E9U824_ANGAN